MSTERVQKWLKRMADARVNPWPYLKYFVVTFDEHDLSEEAIAKPFPQKAMYRIICRAWVEHDILFIEKSRQIMMTWIMAALFLWDAMFKKVRRIYFQSKKQEDANEILDRAKHIFQGLERIGFEGLPTAKKTGEKLGTSESLIFPEIKSSITAIPQGPDIVRSRTWSGGLGDEMNHQPDFLNGYEAAVPALAGGGKLISQGTANGKNAGYKMLYAIDERTNTFMGPNILDSDKIDIPEELKPPRELSPADRRRWIEHKLVTMPDKEFNSYPLEVLCAVMPGMRYWINFQETSCMRVHYTADPDKDPLTPEGKVWLVAAKKKSKSKSKWDREMEIKYDSFEGRPVIDNWDPMIYVPTDPLAYDPNLPLLMASDFGTGVCGCIFGQVGPVTGYNAKQLRILDEVILQNSDTYRLADAILAMIKLKYEYAWQAAHFKMYVDPAGNQTRETTADKSLNTSIKIFKDKGLRPTSRKFGIPESTEFTKAVFSMLYPNGQPAVLVSRNCTYLIDCYEGGWHFPDTDDGIHTGKPEKDGEFDHGGDMTRILIKNAFKTRDLEEDDRPHYKSEFIYGRGGRILGTRKVPVRSHSYARR